MSVRLLSDLVSDEQHLKRLGFWLRIAREAAGKSQSGAAQELKLSASSKSTISDWENGEREPKMSQLRALARYYDVPMELFVNPMPTAFEDLERVKALAAGALEAEAEDWGSQEQEPGPSTGGAEVEPPERRTA